MDYIKGGCQISLMVAIDFTVRKRRESYERRREGKASDRISSRHQMESLKTQPHSITTIQTKTMNTLLLLNQLLVY